MTISALGEKITGKSHDWGKGEYIGYHPPEPSPFGIGYMKPIMKYTCKVCGKRACGDGGSGLLMLQLDEKTCTGK